MIFNTVIVGAGSSGGGSVVTAKAVGTSSAQVGDKVILQGIHMPSYEIVNYTTVGSPTINPSTHVASGFSSANYIQSSTTFDLSQPFEFEYKVDILLGNNYAVFVTLMRDSTIAYGCCTHEGGPSWYLFTLVPVGSSEIMTGLVQYGVSHIQGKLTWDGTTYKQYYKSGGSWVEHMSANSSIGLGTCRVVIGTDITGAWTNTFTGSVFLDDVSLSSNGVVMWKPYMSIQPGEEMAYKYYAEPNQELSYNSNYSITGFVKTNEGVNAWGDTTLKVECFEDPSYTWSNVGTVYGMNVQVNEGELV